MPSAQELKRKKNKSSRDVKSDIKIPKSKTGRTRRLAEVQTIAVTEVLETAEILSDVDVNTDATEQSFNASEQANPSDINIDINATGEAEDSKKIKKTKKLQLPNIFGLSMGAQLLKAKFPKSFGIAEKVIEEWVEDGDFNELPIETPLVQFYVGEGLRRAKDVEKKIETRLDDAGVLPIVRHQLGRAQKWINKK
jgi:hypothetical protein